MIREIKFRGRTAEGTWVYGSLLQSVIDIHGNCNCVIAERFADEYNVFEHDVVPETVGQWIGLVDKNDKEIYEGDYIKLHGGLRLSYYPDNGVIVFNTTSFAMRSENENGVTQHFSINFSDGTEIEILRNIHESNTVEH